MRNSLSHEGTEIFPSGSKLTVSAVLRATRILSSPPILYDRASSATSFRATILSPGEILGSSIRAARCINRFVSELR